MSGRIDNTQGAVGIMYRKLEASHLSCTGCGACVNKCANDAIEYIYNYENDGSMVAQINEEKCVSCHLCETVCPVLTEHSNENQVVDECYAVWANDEIRMQSSSGGVFTVLAEEMLDRGGYVCAVAYGSNFRTEHIIISDKKLELKEQIILFLNRKGYAPVVSCSHCGKVLECPNCSVSLTYHKKKNTVMCHYCGYTQFLEELCGECKIGHFERIGSGTEKVEEHLNILFPNARIERVDQESVGGTKNYEKIFKRFSDGEIDILVGTQMIAKGLDFPNVTLVGALFADMSLHIPDFRSAERTFNLITQVAGRSGRGDKKGIVYIQTYSPNHYSIECAKNHDYISFYNNEILKRKSPLNYPPFSRLVRLVIRGENELKVENDANTIADLLKTLTCQYKDKLEILGAVPCIMSKLNKYYRWNILIKTASHSLLKEFFRLRQAFLQFPFSSAELSHFR